MGKSMGAGTDIIIPAIIDANGGCGAAVARRRAPAHDQSGIQWNTDLIGAV